MVAAIHWWLFSDEAPIDVIQSNVASVFRQHFNGGLKFNLANNEEEDDNVKPWRWKADMVYSSLMLLNRNRFSSCKCRELQWLYNAVSKMLRDGFVSYMFFKCDEMS